jgi:hypothetical protein
MEETGHDRSWARQRGHSAARPDGGWRRWRRPVESENGSAAGMAWPARGWAQSREKTAGCATEKQQSFFGAGSARPRERGEQVSAEGKKGWTGRIYNRRGVRGTHHGRAGKRRSRTVKDGQDGRLRLETDGRGGGDGDGWRQAKPENKKQPHQVRRESGRAWVLGISACLALRGPWQSCGRACLRWQAAADGRWRRRVREGPRRLAGRWMRWKGGRGGARHGGDDLVTAAGEGSREDWQAAEAAGAAAAAAAAAAFGEVRLAKWDGTRGLRRLDLRLELDRGGLPHGRHPASPGRNRKRE